MSIPIDSESYEINVLTNQLFIIVTIIFLPLSFVSSFFGMNTSDIRNINDSQKVFWYT